MENGAGDRLDFPFRLIYCLIDSWAFALVGNSMKLFHKGIGKAEMLDRLIRVILLFSEGYAIPRIDV